MSQPLVSAAFDSLVAATALWAARQASNAGRAALASVGGLLLVAAAAAVGTARYAACPGLAMAHGRLSLLAASVGFPVMACGFCIAAGEIENRSASLIAVVVVGAGGLWLGSSPTYSLAVGALAQIALLVTAVRARDRHPRTLLAVATGVGATTFAVLGVGDEGHWHGIACEDLFHGLVSIGMVGYGAAFSSFPRSKP